MTEQTPRFVEAAPARLGLENTARAASDVEKARAVDIVPELAADDGRGVRAEVRVRERRGALSMDEMSQSNRRKPNTRGQGEARDVSLWEARLPEQQAGRPIATEAKNFRRGQNNRHRISRKERKRRARDCDA